MKKYITKDILSKINFFFKILKKLLIKHPYLVVLILHEYYRNLYNLDSYIPFKKKDFIKRFKENLPQLINFAKLGLRLGSYNVYERKNFFFDKNFLKTEVKSKTGQVYGPLWASFNHKQNLEAKKLLTKRLNPKIFKDKYVLDAGCGGGRYSYAISLLGARKVMAVDYGNQGLSVAKKNYKNAKNLYFKKENILDLSFKDNTFDVVFCNGVLHHTSNLKKGISEILRVCKPGGKIWLYLYSVGGIFWYSRRLMNSLMKNIPYKLSFDFLKMMKMPENRFIFMDNWYVPIEQHCSHKEVLGILHKLKVKKIESILSKNSFDLDYSLKKNPNSELIWGEGEIRFLIQK
jgi:ubiquinone/menaquinone biosynthesis C-methylase UbiE